MSQNEKGKCLLATKDIGKGTYICRYEGELLNYKEGLARFESYGAALGSYMIDFKFDGAIYWLDATVSHQQSLGRCINHSSKANVKGVSKRVDGNPVIYFKAIKDIKCGSEILWNYREPRKMALEQFPFLKQ